MDIQVTQYLQNITGRQDKAPVAPSPLLLCHWLVKQSVTRVVEDVGVPCYHAIEGPHLELRNCTTTFAFDGVHSHLQPSATAIPNPTNRTAGLRHRDPVS